MGHEQNSAKTFDSYLVPASCERILPRGKLCANICQVHYCLEKTCEIFSLGFFRLVLDVSNLGFCRISAISTGRNGRLKPAKLLTLVEHIGNKTRQPSTPLLR